MGSSDGGTATRLGRPPRVTAAEIADAALAIGLERATVRNVAERLGMSVPGLYHHVRTREDLLAMAAAHSMGRLPLPPDRGQPWDRWLLEYGRFVYDALVAQPQIIGQMLSGSYNTVRMVQHLEGVFSVLTRRRLHRGRGRGRPSASVPRRDRRRRGGGQPSDERVRRARASRRPQASRGCARSGLGAARARVPAIRGFLGARGAFRRGPSNRRGHAGRAIGLRLASERQ